MENLTSQLQAITQSLPHFYSEIFLVVLALTILIADFFKQEKALAYLTLAGLMFNLVCINLNFQQEITFFQNWLLLNPFIIFFKNLFSITGIFVIIQKLLSRELENVSKKKSGFKLSGQGELYSILVMMILGLQLMAMGQNLLIIYLALELVSIASYILTIFKFDKKGAEASIKYLLFGAFSSGIMLYGMSWLYGLSGSLFLNEIQLNIEQLASPVLFYFALFLTFGGLFFKIATAPFHIWAANTYEAAPTFVVTFFSIAPKAAGIAVLSNFYFVLSADHSTYIIQLLAVIAIVTVFVGNLSALWQTNAKRMLAYSSIAHSGFLLMAVLALRENNLNSLIFYLVTYTLMNLGIFAFIAFFENREAKIESYKGVGLQNPFLGIIILIFMIALTGLPPTAGFTAKLFVFTSLWESYQETGSQWIFWAFILGLLNTVISLFYYLKIPYFAFFKKSSEGIYAPTFSITQKLFVAIFAFSLLLLFFLPQVLI